MKMETSPFSPNPLQHSNMPEILENIVGNLKVGDLKSCRLVCTLWREEAGKSLRSTQVTLSDDPDKGEELVRTIENSVSKWQRLSKFCIRGMRLLPWKFWQTCGTHITHLRIEARVATEAEFYRVIFESCPVLKYLHLEKTGWGNHAANPTPWVPRAYGANKSLETLILQDCDFLDFKHWEWKKLIEQFPFLKNLDVKDGYYVDLFNDLEAARHINPGLWRLKKVKINFSHLDVYRVGKLLTRGTSLEFLQVEEITGIDEVIVLEKVLSNHSSTLKHLVLKGEAVNPWTTLSFLESLILEVKTEHPHILRFTPVLKALDLKCGVGIHEDVELYECEKLSLEFSKVTVNDIEKLGNSIPNLNTLWIKSPIDSDIFSAICNAWHSLTSLKLTMKSDFDDGGFVGLDAEYAEMVNREREGNNTWRIRVLRANLSSLQNLQILYLNLTSLRRPLGYCVASCGVMELPELKQLRIDVHSQEYLASGIWSSLLENFPWIPNTHHDDWSF